MNLAVDIIIWIAYITSLYFSIFLFLVFLDKRKTISLDQIDSSLSSLAHYPMVSILVPAYNEEKTILQTLESIAGIDYPTEKLEVIIIDDGSSDQTRSLVEKYCQSLGKKQQRQWKVLSHANRGKAASLNRALNLARGSFFACLDADSFVDPLTLRKMLSLYYHKNDPRIAIVTPAMKVHQPKNVLQKIQWLEYIVMIFIGRLTSRLDSLYVAPGPFSLYKTQVIKDLGGFDEEIMTEDQEIAYRLQQQQYRIKQCPQGYVYTTAPCTLGDFYRQRRRWYLGSIACLHKYRGMVANTKYGDFGIMQLVKNLTGFVLALTGISIAFYLLVFPLALKLKNLFLIKFNIIPYILNFHLKFNLLTILATNMRKGFILASLLLLGFVFFYQAHKNANERMMKFGWLPLVPYVAFYYLLKGTILLLSVAEFARGRKIQW